MKITSCLILLFATISVWADKYEPRTPYTWSQDIVDSPAEKTLFRIAVPNDVFDGCEIFPNDLRIYGTGTEPWPFYTWEKPDRTRFDTLQGNILNRSKAEGDSPHRVLEIELGSPNKRGRHNRIRINTNGDNFVRKVEVLGSADREEWLKLADGWLIDHTRPTRARNTEIRYPESDFPYLKIRIWPNARNAGKIPVVSSFEVGKFVSRPGDWETVPIDDGPIPEEDKTEDYAATTYFDTGAKNRPLERLKLIVADETFARPIQVYARNTPTSEWRQVYNGEIHRFGDKERVEFALHNFAARYIKVVAFHYDDPPLQITGAIGRALTRYLVVEARDDAPAALHYGSQVARTPPRFDLQGRKDASHAAVAPIIALAARTTNQAYAKRRFEAMMPWITGAVIALVSGILIWVIAGMLKQRPAG